MKIKRTSWHYRLLDFFSMQVPGNLCTYFWKVFFTGVLGALIFFVAIPCVIFTAVSPFVLGVLYFLVGSAPGSIIMIIGTAAIIVAAVFGFIFGGVWSVEWVKDHPVSFSKAGEPSVVVEYIKAKHRKICPILEFQD